MPQSTVFNVSSVLIVHILVMFEAFIPSSKHLYAGLTNPAEQSSSSEYCRPTSQEIPRVTWEKNVHYHLHKIPLLDSIMKNYSSWHPPTLYA
jgi:hypothetical protein